MHYCISSCRLSRLSLVVCLQSTVCLSVCLCACLWRGQLLQMFDIRFSEWPLVQVFQKVVNIFNDLDLLHAFYFSQWFILFQFTFFWKYINILLQPYVRHWFLKWPRLAWLQNKIPRMLRNEWSFFLSLWKEGGNLFQKWNGKKLRTCCPYW